MVGLLGGCVREPYPKLPDRPPVIFFSCDTDKVCMTKPQADVLAEYFEKLNAIDAERARRMKKKE